MALLLHRIGRFAYRRAWLVIVAWMLTLGALVGLGLGLGGQLKDSFAIPGTESQTAIDQLAAVFPQTAGASAKAVVEAPDGSSVDDAPYRDAITDMESALEDVDGVVSVLGPFDEYAGKQVSDDGRTAFIQVQFDGPNTEVTVESKDAVVATGAVGEDAGLRVAFGGEVFQDTSFGLTITEVLGVVFAGVVLIIAFGSLLAAGMPLLTALVGVGIAFGGISIVAAFAPVSSTAPMLAVMIGLAVGIDYALFILSRHRTQLARGQEPEDSAAESVATAGGAVVFAGLTVIIALLGLLVVGIPFLSVMGVAAAFAVLVAVAAAVTLLPALLGVLGRRLVPKTGSRAHRRANASDDGGRRTMGRRWVDLVLKAPVVFLVVVIGLLGAAAIPAASIDLNLPSGATAAAGSEEREAYDMIADGFGPGYNGPLIVTVDITQTTDIFEDLDAIGARLAEVDGVVYVGDGLPNETVDTAIIQVIPESAPNDPETKQIVQEIRELQPQIEEDFGTPIAVTGYTAVSIDISNRLNDALVPFALIVVGLSVVLLLLVFRSVFVPIKAALGFLLSAFAAIGVSVAVFQWGWMAEFLHIEPGPILSFLPILLIAVLFGLAMDYEVFLVSGMREEFVKTREPRGSVVHGFQHAARVVTAAALIMFFVFFAFVPEGSGAIKAIAFALAIGVAFDAFLVRMTLVPAAMVLAGRAAWWLPKWLEKRLPNVDIEGEGLRAHLEQEEWAAARPAAINADAAVFGLAERPIGPLTVEVPAGGVLVVRGEAVDSPGRRRNARRTARARRRAPRRTGCAAAHRRERGHARRRDRRGRRTDVPTGGTVGELIAARLDATRPWYRLRPSSALVEEWATRAADAVGHTLDGPPVRRRHADRHAGRRDACGRRCRCRARRASEGRRDRPRRRPERGEHRSCGDALARLVPVDRDPRRRHRRRGDPARRLAAARGTGHPNHRTRLRTRPSRRTSGGTSMSTRLSRLFGTTPAQRRTRYGVLVAAVIAVPLAVAGLMSGALGGAGDNLEQIPAVVVNNDEMVTMTLPDGTEQPVLAGRQLVTELTGPDTAGFAWTISNDDEAAELLASGDAYVVLTIPADFSESVTSISSESPTQANLDIRTDDAHGYLTGSVAQSVGDAMSTAFGRELTTQYLEGFYTNLATMGGGARRRRRRCDAAVVGRRRARERARHARRRRRFGRVGGVGCRERRHPVRRRRRPVHDGVDGIASGLTSYSAGVAEVHAGRRRHRRGTRAARHERRAARCALRRLGPVRRRDQRGRRPGRAGGHAPDRGARAARDRPARTRAADR